MNRTRIAIVTVAAALGALGVGAAVGATSSEPADRPERAEQEVLDDAAQRLGVEPDELREALREALDARLERAVQEGSLTEEQAEAIRERRGGRVLGLRGQGRPGGRPGWRGRGGAPGHHRGAGRGGPRVLSEVAQALDLSVRELFSRLRGGETPAEIAEAQGKSLEEVKEGAMTAAEERLDRAVEDERLSREQADRIREQLEERFDRFAERGFPAPPHKGGGFGP